MQLPVIRACAAGVTDPMIGINAMIDGLTLDDPADVRPAHVRIYNYVDDAWVSNKMLQMEEVRNGIITLPALILYIEQPPTIEAEVGAATPTIRNGEFTVVFSYVSAEPASVKEVRDAFYVNWAMLKFLTLFNANTTASLALRTRGSISLFRCLKLDQYTPFSPFGEVSETATTTATFAVREHSP